MKKLVYGVLIALGLLVSGCTDAGKDQTVESGATVTLNGSKSQPSVGGTIKKYVWEQVRGEHVRLSSQHGAIVTFIAPSVKKKTRLVFRLKTVEYGGNPRHFHSYAYTNVYVVPKVVSPELSWFLEQHNDLKNNYFVGEFGVDNHPSGWDRGAYLRAYIDMYEATHDIRILRNLNELLKIVADGNDILTGRIDDRVGAVLPGWGTRAYSYGPNGGERYSDMLTNALYAYPLAAFARIVKENKNLKDEFGTDADKYYKMVANLYTIQKPFKETKASPYKDGTVGDCYVYPDGYYADKDNLSNVEAPINWTVIIAEPLIELYRASLAGGKVNKEYRNTVMKVSNYIWKNMHLNKTPSKDKYLTWYYWPTDINPDTATRMEDLTHGARLAEFVVSLHDAKIEYPLLKKWTNKRLNYLANTFTFGAVLNDTTFSNYIDGTGGVYEDDPATLFEWLELQKFSHKSSHHTIDYYIEKAMESKGEDKEYNIAVFAKFIRYGKD